MGPRAESEQQQWRPLPPLPPLSPPARGGLFLAKLGFPSHLLHLLHLLQTSSATPLLINPGCIPASTALPRFLQPPQPARSHTHLLAASSLCLLLPCLWVAPCKWVLCEDGQAWELWRVFWVLGQAGEFFDGPVREAGFRRCWSARGGFFAVVAFSEDGGLAVRSLELVV